jgi:hypothetical protein
LCSILDVGYEWLNGALDFLRGIEPHEVIQVLTADRRWPRLAADSTSVIRVLTIWGRTRGGRPLIVVVRQVSEWDWQIVGARDMRPGEVMEFDEWEAKR